MPDITVPQSSSDQQPFLFDPDLELIRYLAEHATIDVTYDGKLHTVWLTQKQMAEMYRLTRQAIGAHVQNFKEARPEDAGSVIKKFLLTASDGKQYQVEHYSLPVIIYIGYRAQVTTQTIAFQRFAERIIQERFTAEHERALRKARYHRDADITGYLLAGQSQAWSELRVETKDTFKSLMAQVARVCDDKRAFAQLTNQEYLDLLGATAAQLRLILNAKKIRDALPSLQLDYLRLAEHSLTTILQSQNTLTADQLIKLATITFEPLGSHLRTICDMAGIDVASGRPLLKD